MVVIRSPSPQLVPFKLHRFGKQRLYSDIDNVLPDPLVSMIHNGLQLWSSKFILRASTNEEKIDYIANITPQITIKKLRDCVILGLVFTTGVRPVQLAKEGANKSLI